jgi:hypothetical protein
LDEQRSAEKQYAQRPGRTYKVSGATKAGMNSEFNTGDARSLINNFFGAAAEGRSGVVVDYTRSAPKLPSKGNRIALHGEKSAHLSKENYADI